MLVLGQMVLQPVQTLRFCDLRQPAADRVLAHHALHAEQFGIHRLAAQRGDVRVAAVPGQHRQHQRAERVALARRVRAGQVQRTVRHPFIKQTGLFQVIDEERQLTERRDRYLVVPFNANPAGKRVCRRRPGINRRLFTRWVNRQSLLVLFHSSLFRRLQPDRATANCRI